ncbi:hypothetical protein HRTV-25_gp82 [Halorubrum tailed virus 25]|uniref:Uncharacterized protein n=1 Tax=Halorubrum tailed virus 25 TaxID=2878006 RepID=A0AAE8Y146_9CAUD|nr:hypothetical protein M1M37_gp082 [Halorubrum tailed virus 25]UBF22663.1 hypothetical protein HRTV-25_gp82 [Halorubrum tailed virus 25]
MLDTTSEIEDEVLAEYIINQAHLIGDWETFFPEADLADPDGVYDAVRVGNVDFLDYYGEGVFELEGSFKTSVITEHIRGSFHHPPEVRTRKAKGKFHIRFEMEDEGYASGGIEVW